MNAIRIRKTIKTTVSKKVVANKLDNGKLS